MADIAHHLATLNRWGGALLEPVSVAQHSVMVAMEAFRLLRPESSPVRTILWALLHDAHEAYIGDALRPVSKALLFQRIGDDGQPEVLTRKQLAIEWDHAIFAGLGLPASWVDLSRKCPLIGRADGASLHAEARDLTVVDKSGWSGLQVPPLEATVRPWPWGVARARFLAAWNTWEPGSVRNSIGQADMDDPFGFKANGCAIDPQQHEHQLEDTRS